MKRERESQKTLESLLHSSICDAHTVNHILRLDALGREYQGADDLFHARLGAILLQLQQEVLEHIEARAKDEKVAFAIAAIKLTCSDIED